MNNILVYSCKVNKNCVDTQRLGFIFPITKTI